MTRVRFYYDVVCPYSYLESHVMEAAEDSGAVEIEWLPFELRPAPRPLLDWSTSEVLVSEFVSGTTLADGGSPGDDAAGVLVAAAGIAGAGPLAP